MSIWTHVAAIVRVDSLRVDSNDIPNFEKVFGKELKYDDSRETWDYALDHKDEFLPFGSEGSLTMSVWVNPDPSYIAAYTISIFGDLRDYDGGPSKVVEWFKEKCLANLARRNAIIVANTDTGPKYTWCYDN